MKQKFNPSAIARTAFFLIIGATLKAFAVYYFIVPMQFAPGGVTGISSMLNYAFEWNVSLLVLIFNIPLVLLSFKKLSLEFAIKSAITIGLMSFIMQFYAWIKLPTYNMLESSDLLKGSEGIMAAIFAGVITGIGFAMIFKQNASTGGSDIVGAVIQKKHSATNVAWFIWMVDAVVVITSVFVFPNGLSAAMFSFVTLFVSSKTAETILNGFSSAITFNVITKKPVEVSAKIIQELSRGVTIIKGTGAYTMEESTMLICVVRKRQMNDFHNILKIVDKDAFAFATSTREVLGKGFTD